ncbi:MAG: type III pantothenate kinase [Paludibacteraceae bacterium]|nr:type III pantothenate kinase [Paludibacteraceae bacterium]
MTLAIDIGNSYTKLGVFDNNYLIFKDIIHKNESRGLGKIVETYDIRKVVVSTVGREDLTEKEAIERGFEVIRISQNMKLPFENGYLTPETLGLDRIAGMAGACGKYENCKDFLVMDLGTCNTYDVILNGKFIGGNIAPGLEMRLRAMHEFTAKLPKVEVEEAIDIKENIGRSTREAIGCGALRGMIDEMNACIGRFREASPIGKIIMTGGYGEMVYEMVDSPVEYDPFLVLWGLKTVCE